MSDLIKELRSYGLRVDSESRPFEGVERGRIKDAVAQLVPGATMDERAKAVGLSSAQTLYNWSNKPGSISREKAERFIDGMALAVKELYSLKAGDARRVVLQRLAASKSERAYNRGMQLILGHLYDYLVADELYSLCELATTKVLYERGGQVVEPAHGPAHESDRESDRESAQAFAQAFLELAEQWRSLYKKRQSQGAAATADDVEKLQRAIEEFEPFCEGGRKRQA